MSSTERAPEPTMEDILASIRRIITDDEAGKGPADQSAAADRTEEEGLEGEADNQIIDNIARVLSSGGEPPANEDEEIMDLTGELGGLELVEDEPETLVQTAEIADVAPEFVDAPDDADDLLELDAQPDVIQPDVIEPDVLETELEVIETLEVEETLEVAEFVEPVEVPPPLEAMPEPAMPPMTPPPVPEPMPAAVAEAAPEAPKLSASEEAATALERAIAALKAGQAPVAAKAPVAAATTVAAAAAAPAFGTPAFEPEAVSAEPEAMASEPQMGVIPAPDELPMAVPMDSPTPEPETHLDPDADSVLEMAGAEDVPEPLMEADTALDLTETETTETLVDTMILEEVVLEEMAVPEAEAPMAEPVPGFIPTPSEVVSAAVMAGTNGLAAHEAPASGAEGVETLGSETPIAELPMSESPVSESPASKSLEDSIKEMLRPMLREWLNENMPRMIREELDSDAVQRGRD